MVLSVVAALVVKNYGNNAVLDLPGFKVGCVNGTAQIPNSHFDPLACAGNQVVYRFSFALVCFFVIMTIGAMASRAFHAAMWPLKTLIYVGLTVGCFFVHNSACAARAARAAQASLRLSAAFYHSYVDVSRVVSILFLLLQARGAPVAPARACVPINVVSAPRRC